jgi:hypothetical protein
MGIIERCKQARRNEEVAALCAQLRQGGHFTYAEQAAELNRRGERTERGVLWTAQSVYLCCRRHRTRLGRNPLSSGEVHDLVDGRWRDRMRTKILELKSYGVTRYDDIARNLNEEGITTRLGRAWTLQSVHRLMRSIGLPAGKPGRRSRDE